MPALHLQTTEGETQCPLHSAPLLQWHVRDKALQQSGKPGNIIHLPL